jgi:hypothetical protein
MESLQSINTSVSLTFLPTVVSTPGRNAPTVSYSELSTAWTKSPKFWATTTPKMTVLTAPRISLATPSLAQSVFTSELQPRSIGIWQGVAMNSPKFHSGPPCPTLLCPAGGPGGQAARGSFQEWPARRAGGMRPSHTLLYTPRNTPMNPGRHSWDVQMSR